MGTTVATAMILAGLFSQVRQEEPKKRIHLRNGDYIEGRLLGETPAGFEVKVEDGVLLILKHQVAKVETPMIRIHDSPPPRLYLMAPAGDAPRKPRASNGMGAAPVSRGRTGRLEAVLDALDRKFISRDEAMRRILDQGPDAAVPLASLLDALVPDLRNLAVHCLAALNNPETLPELFRLLGSENPDVRKAAAGLVGMAGDRNASRRIRPLLRDRDPEVRAAAASALDNLDDPHSVEFLGPLCADPEPVARVAAIDATIRLAQRHEMKENLLWALDRALRWPPKDGEGDLLRAVGSTGQAEAWTLAARHLASSSDKVRAAAAQALGLLASPESRDVIRQQMEVELGPEPRLQLCFAAERLRMPEAGPTLIEWLSESDENVRRAALRALRAISGLVLGEDPVPWSEWWASR